MDTDPLDNIELEDLYEITFLLTILSILIAVLNLIRHILFKRFKILIENIYNEKKLNIYEGAWTQRKIAITALETIGILMSPSFLLVGKQWVIKTGEEHQLTIYNYNDILHFFNILKILLIIRSLFSSSEYYSIHYHRIA